MADEFRRGDALHHLQRGIVLERANRIKEAVDAYRQALSQNPRLREAHNALGVYYQRQGLLAKAAEEFRIVASLESDFLAHFNLGYVLVELGRYEEALHAFEQCLRLAPDDPATLYELGYISYSRGDYHAAVERLQAPLRLYPDDWEIYNLLGSCYLGLRRFDDALAALGRALVLASNVADKAALLNQIATVERHREFRSLGSAKDQMYAQDGVVYLGSAQDDGLQLREVDDYHFTYPDIGTTLQRLLALQQGYRWQFNAVVALDKASRPLAQALARASDLPLCTANTLRPDMVALLVIAVAREPELLELTLERLPCQSATFCLGLNWLRRSRVLPDMIGIAARNACSVPWEGELRRLRADGAAPAQIESCLERATEAILAAVTDTPPDSNLPRQVRYYTRVHRRLSFPPTLPPSLS
ncbi:MAG: tetratricopeptide repeat protein [Chloroflexales bacterium]|nr:tetratricopeptide repeat protein [Chloroflexales bacterium]